jgi:hypothetical protein
MSKKATGRTMTRTVNVDDNDDGEGNNDGGRQTMEHKARW